MSRTQVMGIIGGVASGKSEVTRILESLGAKVIHADPIGHEVLKDPEVIDLLVAHFGAHIVDPVRGVIDRSRVASLVFGRDSRAIENRRYLESVVHPRIRARIDEELRRLKRDASLACIVLDVPLLIESGWDSMCDRVLFIDASESDRLCRARARGWSELEFHNREQAQASIDVKRAAATDVIENTGSLADLENKVRCWWAR